MSVKTEKSTNYQSPKEPVTSEAMEQFAQVFINYITDRLNHLAVEQKPTNGQSTSAAPKLSLIENDLNEQFKHLEQHYDGQKLRNVIKTFISKL